MSTHDHDHWIDEEFPIAGPAPTFATLLRGLADALERALGRVPTPSLNNRALVFAFDILANEFDKEKNPAEFGVRHVRIAVEAYLQALGSAPREPDETGWVIERGSPPVYWGGLYSAPYLESCWSTLHQDAVRFARHQDAYIVAHWLGVKDTSRIVEHRWMVVGSAPRGTGEHTKEQLSQAKELLTAWVDNYPNISDEEGPYLLRDTKRWLELNDKTT
jgi:hypothetical protein